jgi:hypothetical protein
MSLYEENGASAGILDLSTFVLDFFPFFAFFAAFFAFFAKGVNRFGLRLLRPTALSGLNQLRLP